MMSLKGVPSDRPGLSLESIAALSNSQLAELTPAELVAMIQLVEPYIPQPDWDASIHEQDSATLLKMGFCARECCRHLLSSADSEVQKCGDDESCGCPHCS